jgi:bifunctional non-homologous end joining protein LigD
VNVYSLRAKEQPTVSTPVTWDEVEAGFRIEDFRIDNVPSRVGKLGDLWKPLLAARGRFPLDQLF